MVSFLLRQTGPRRSESLDSLEGRAVPGRQGPGPGGSHDPVDGEGLALNDIARVGLRLAEPDAADPYAQSRATGAFVLIDEATNDTVAGGMIAA